MGYDDILKTKPDSLINSVSIFVLILIPVIIAITLIVISVKNKEGAKNYILATFLGVLFGSLISMMLSVVLLGITSYKTATWENEKMIPFIIKNVEKQETTDIMSINKTGLNRGESEVTFNKEDEVYTKKAKVIPDLSKKDKPKITYKFNDTFIPKGSSDIDIGSLDNILKDDKIKKYIGMFDVKIHVPKNFNFNKNKLVE